MNIPELKEAMDLVKDILSDKPNPKATNCEQYFKEYKEALEVLLSYVEIGIKEIKEPFNRPPSNHLEVNYIAVGYYKHEIDFGVLGSVKELSAIEFNKMLNMLQTAIKVAKEMRGFKNPI